jgi:calcium/proton exchanger cax
VLVLGMCFCAGGLRFAEQGFGMTAAQTNSSLLMVSVIALLLPAMLYYAMGAGGQPQTGANDGSITAASEASANILKLSHGVALLMLLSAWLFAYTCERLTELISTQHTHAIALFSCGRTNMCSKTSDSRPSSIASGEAVSRTHRRYSHSGAAIQA